MQESMLKVDWERSQQEVELTIDVARQLLLPVTQAHVVALKLMADGSANSNYKVSFNDGRQVLLRLYQREPSSLLREVGVEKLVQGVVPVAKFLHVDDTFQHFPYPYAVMEWVEGVLMRDFLFTANEAAMSSAMFEVGQQLSLLRRLRLPQGGVFTDAMQIKPFDESDGDYLSFVGQLLEDPVVKASLGKNLHHDAHDLASKCCDLFPLMNDANLTHGDFDPANILLQEVQGEWKVSAVLDWEFAHAGSYLTDIGLMLRYGHQLPAYFESSFIRGIEEAGAPLPSDWKKQSQLMNLLCLLQVLHANPAAERPYINRDVVRLITRMVKTLPQIK